MKKQILLPIALLQLLIFNACENHGIEKPDQLISEKKMEKILLDVVIMKSAKSNNRGQLNSDTLFGDQYLYKKYNITADQLQESEIYYSKIPKIYIRMHRNVLIRLEQISDSLERVIKLEKDAQMEKKGVR